MLKRILSASALRLTAQITAFASGVIIAAAFGASAVTDAYYAALILPAALANLIVNVLTNTFAPVYLAHLRDDASQRGAVVRSLLFVAILAFGGALIVCLLSLPFIASGHGTNALTIGVVLALTTPLIGLARLLSVVLETEQRYAIPAAASVISSLAFVGLLVALIPFGAVALVIANLTAITLQVIILAVYIQRTLNIHLIPQIRLHPVVKTLIHQAGAPALAYGALLFIPTADRLMVSGLPAGSLTAFHYADRTVSAFEMLLMSGVVLVMATGWAHLHAANGIASAAHRAADEIARLLFVLMPVGVGGALLSQPIMSLLFGRGAFAAVDTSAAVFALLLLSQMFNILIVLAVRLLLLTQNTRAQLMLSLAAAALNLCLNLLLIAPFGVAGVALSTLITRVLVLIGAFAFIRHTIPGFAFKPLIARALHTTLCTLVMGIAVVTLQAPLVLAVCIGAAVYLAAAWLTRHPDLRPLSEQVQFRFRPRQESA